MIDEKTQAALNQIGREEKAAAADEVSPIVRHRASMARLKAMGFATLNASYGLDQPLPQHKISFAFRQCPGRMQTVRQDDDPVTNNP